MISVAVINLVTPKAGAKQEHLFNGLASGAYPSGVHHQVVMHVSLLGNIKLACKTCK